MRLLQLAANRQRSVFKINIVPLQAEDFRLPQSRKQIHDEKPFKWIAFDCLQEAANIIIHKRFQIRLFHFWQLNMI